MSAVVAPGAPVREPAVPGPAPARVQTPVHAPVPSRLRRTAARHPRVVDALVAAAVQLAGLPITLRSDPQPWLWVFDLALVVPLVWRRRAPVVVFAVLAAVALVQWVVGFMLGADAALLVSLYTVAAYRPRRWAVAAAAVVEVGVVLAAVRFSPARGLVASLVFLTGLAAAAFFVGTTIRNRRAYLGSLVERAAWLERERDQQAQLSATAERARIAREMHDIVAHSLTVVVTLAEAAAVTVEADPPAARQTMTQVATTGRTALAEMRRLLGVLRSDQPGLPADDPRTLAPAPGLDRLDDLVANARAAALPVRLTVSGRPRPVPSTFEATAYRVVQESLTNVLRHAVEPTRVDVVLRWEDGVLAVAVTDDGRRRPAPPSSGGQGLRGMRQRLAVFGGTLVTGPRQGGGWSVEAQLPYPGDQ
jgi:signal transduction histidine kinase